MKKIMFGIMVLVSLIFVGSVKAEDKAYSIGDKITVAGDEYYVIANSPTSQDYVVALKEKPLTYDEVVAAGGENPVIRESYGEIAFELTRQATPNDYSTSNAKKVVDAWANDKFSNNELKEVNGYKARLITLDELTTNFGFDCGNEYTPSCNVPSGVTIKSWIYSPVSGVLYYTMTPNTLDSISVWTITDTVVQKNPTASYGLIRPVINISKTNSDMKQSSDDSSNSNNNSEVSGSKSTNNNTDNNNVNVEDTLLQKSLIGTIIGLVLIGMGISIYLFTLKKSKK